MRTSKTDKLVLAERNKAVTYLEKVKLPSWGWAVDHGRHLPKRMAAEPQDDEHAVQIERSHIVSYLRRFCRADLNEPAADIETGKHVGEGRSDAEKVVSWLAAEGCLDGLSPEELSALEEDVEEGK